MRLEKQRRFRRERCAFFVVVRESFVIDDEFAVQVYRHPVAECDDAKLVPFPSRIVRHHERIFATVSNRVIPKATAAFGIAVFDLIWVGWIPHLNLWHRFWVNAAIDRFGELVFDEELGVTVVLRSGRLGAHSIVDEFAIFNFGCNFLSRSLQRQSSMLQPISGRIF